MQTCIPHWEQCRAKVAALGLDEFVPKTEDHAKAMFERALDTVNTMIASGKRELPHKMTREDFDPLSAMNWGFMSRVIQQAGLGVMTMREGDDGMPENGGHYCPLCVVRLHFDRHFVTACGDPKCTILAYGCELPWDEHWIERCGDGQYRLAIEHGLIKLS